MNFMNTKLYKGKSLILDQSKVPYSLKENTLFFDLDFMHHSINFETQEFIRENEEYQFYLNIAEEKCEITLKNEGYHLQVLVEYANLLKNKNFCEITYQIETDEEEIKFVLE